MNAPSRRPTRLLLPALALAGLAAGGGVALWRGKASAPAPAAQPVPEAPVDLEPHTRAMFAPPPGGTKAPEDTPPQVELGRLLFFDPRLSKNHDVSCNSCHVLSAYGVDGKALSDGHRGQKGTRNSPTVFHAAGHVAQFWDGRAATLEEQASVPMLNPVEMAMPDEARVVRTLSSIPEYRALFAQAFPKEKRPVRLDTAARALAAFQRTLSTRSRFDRYLAGERSALTPAELRGLHTFVTSGCTTCHNGPALGGTSFQKLGLVGDYAKDFPETKDPGRFEVTHDEEDLMKFRVPTLRNVTRTGPWFHDGSVKSLPEAVRRMGRYQLGRSFTDAQVADLVAFLESLTGELPAALVAPPKLPPSTKATPRPDPS
jgi:cytochrome c peroxidase